MKGIHLWVSEICSGNETRADGRTDLRQDIRGDANTPAPASSNKTSLHSTFILTGWVCLNIEVLISAVPTQKYLKMSLSARRCSRPMVRKPFIRPNAFKQYIITKLLNNVVAQY